GGIIDAKVPEEAIIPEANLLLYFKRRISGNAALPNTVTAAIEAPDIAPKTALANVVAIPIEPGIPDAIPSALLYALPASPVSTASPPSKINKGMAIHVGDAIASNDD